MVNGTDESNSTANSGRENVQIKPFDYISVTDERLLTGDKKVFARDTLVRELKKKNAKVEDADAAFHLGIMLHAYAMRTTSKKASNTEGNFLTYKYGGADFAFTEKDYSAVFEALQLRGSNRARVFCRSFGEEYIKFQKEYANKLPPNPRALKLGLPSQHHYLAADFLDGCPILTDHEAAVFVRGRDRALISETDAGKFVANVYELGSH